MRARWADATENTLDGLRLDGPDWWLHARASNTEPVVRIIAEAFRPQPGGGFRSATVEELMPQLQHYRGYRVWLFDGPHYVNDALVEALRPR